MNSDEKGIIDYLKTWRNTFVSGREIAKKVGGKRRYEEDRGWAVPILTAMVQSGLLEKDHMGHFRLMPEDVKKKKKVRTYVSPQILKILKRSGKSFDGLEIDDANNATPDATKPPQ